MPRAVPTFRQADLTRALRAAVAAGVKVAKVEIEGGKITIHSETAVPAEPASDLDRWMAGRARQA